MPPIQELIQHIRTNPDELDVCALSDKFGLDEGLVAKVVDSLPPLVGAQVTSKQNNNFSKLQSWWGRVLENPKRLLIGLFLLSFSVSILASMALSYLNWPAPGGSLAGSAILVVQLATALVSWAFCFAKGMVRYSFLASLGQGGVLAAILLLLSGSPIALLQGVLVSIFLAMVAVPASLLGGLRQVRAARAEDRAMSRQEMLARLLEIRDLLKVDRPMEVERSFADEPSVIWLRRRLLPASTIVFFGLLAVENGFHIVFWPEGASGLTARAISMGLYELAFGLANLAAAFLVGLIAKRMRLSLAAVALGQLAQLGIQFTQLARTSAAQYFGNPVPVVVGILLMFLAGIAGAIAAQIDEHAVQSRRLAQNDPDSLFAQMLDLEWRLTPKAKRVAVMVVDVAGSTRMKETADPFEAEWCFREYQLFVERVCDEFGGVVFSRAGDGAVVGFDTAKHAVAAATEIQGRIAAFNTNINRISPFALRIGIHVGEVMGQLDEVEFSQVIDLAAHVEQSCPIGRIALSQEAAKEFDEGRTEYVESGSKVAFRLLSSASGLAESSIS